MALSATGHTPVVDPAVAATYTTKGKTEGSHCEVCGAVLVKQKAVAKLKLPTGGVLLAKNRKKTVAAGRTLRIVLNEGKIKACKSSNTAVATVTQAGKVKAKLAGVTTITVTPKSGKKLTLKLTVTDTRAPKRIQITRGKKLTLKKGKKLTLKTTLTPAKARTKLAWKSSNKKVATVTQKGVVKALKKGVAKITVTTTNGKKATLTVTVK